VVDVTDPDLTPETVPAPDSVTGPVERTSIAASHPVLLYTGLRIVVFVAVLVVLYLFGLRQLWLLVFAFLLSGFASVFLLGRTRESAVGGFSSGFRRLNDRIDASSRAEDGDELFDTPPSDLPPSAGQDQA